MCVQLIAIMGDSYDCIKEQEMAEGLVHALHSGAAKQETLRRVAGAGESTGKGPAKVDGTWDPPWTKR